LDELSESDEDDEAACGISKNLIDKYTIGTLVGDEENKYSAPFNGQTGQ
jgi:hypothetical protein